MALMRINQASGTRRSRRLQNLLFLKKLWRSRLAWSRAHDWKSCRRQKRLESSNLSFSATSKSPGNAFEQCIPGLFFSFYSDPCLPCLQPLRGIDFELRQYESEFICPGRSAGRKIRPAPCCMFRSCFALRLSLHSRQRWSPRSHRRPSSCGRGTSQRSAQR